MRSVTNGYVQGPEGYRTNAHSARDAGFTRPTTAESLTAPRPFYVGFTLLKRKKAALDKYISISTTCLLERTLVRIVKLAPTGSCLAVSIFLSSSNRLWLVFACQSNQSIP